MLGVFGKKQSEEKQRKLPYSFGYAPLIVGLFVIGLVMWWWLAEDPRPTLLTAPGGFWTVMAFSAGMVISGVIGLGFVWRVNHAQEADHVPESP